MNLSTMNCREDAPVLQDEERASLMSELNPGWAVSEDGLSVCRRYEFKGFARAVYFSNLAVFVADQQNHHPDIAFGWGYCEISYTTHSAKGLTLNDFICAAVLDRFVAG